MAGNLDLYGLLELQPDATDKDITRAYRKKALKYHVCSMPPFSSSSAFPLVLPRPTPYQRTRTFALSIERECGLGHKPWVVKDIALSGLNAAAEQKTNARSVLSILLIFSLPSKNSLSNFYSRTRTTLRRRSRFSMTYPRRTRFYWIPRRAQRTMPCSRRKRPRRPATCRWERRGES